MKRILIANRGEIAQRVIRSCARRGLETVLAVSQADLGTRPAMLADRIVRVGPGPARLSYLNGQAMVAAAIMSGCDAVHPGYGFLSEDAGFARACREAGLTFVGPSPEMLDLFGDKVLARAAATRIGVPVAQASGALLDIGEAYAAADEVGYPAVLKAVHGGGGKGMRLVHDRRQLRQSYPVAVREALAAFGDGSLYVERWIDVARHVEVQVAGDGHGTVIHFGDRDCSIQRRHQKLIEEAPAPALGEDLQVRIRQAAVELCASVTYDSIGTVEFVVDAEAARFFFIEVNPRIQVEHGVTELVTGVDLVDRQLDIAAGAGIGTEQDAVTVSGVAIECRVNAESPSHGFRPSPGLITEWWTPHAPDVRIDSHLFPGYHVPPHYDSLIAKVMVHGEDRRGAIKRMGRVLQTVRVEGVDTTIALQRWILSQEDFATAVHHTRWLDERLSVATGTGWEDRR